MNKPVKGDFILNNEQAKRELEAFKTKIRDFIDLRDEALGYMVSETIFKKEPYNFMKNEMVRDTIKLQAIEEYGIHDLSLKERENWIEQLVT